MCRAMACSGRVAPTRVTLRSSSGEENRAEAFLPGTDKPHRTASQQLWLEISPSSTGSFTCPPRGGTNERGIREPSDVAPLKADHRDPRGDGPLLPRPASL